ncbi:MAG: tyrosine-type recombinase/integrase [Planctomycetaceae bacterium]|nr:tyrosine-type recombinase/integrase [Planctomycetaceae bacterium]
MASLNADKAGNRRLQFRAPNGKRVTLYLGRLPLRKAEIVKSYVERLLLAAVSGDNVDTDTASWLTRITDELHEKLASCGLVKPRDETTVGRLVADFIAANPHAKPATLVVWRHTKRNLVAHFGKGRQLRTIGAPDAEGFRQYLVDQKLAGTTVMKRLQFARQFFTHAVRREWIDRNPFENVSHKGGNPADKQRYISEADTKLLVDAAPNWVWRTMIALSRFGGLRCPSEVLSLRLADLNWQRGSMTVISPKTEGHGQGRRVVPMFARLRPYLEEAWQMAKEGQVNVIPESLYLPAANGPRGWNGCNLRTTFQKIVARAGLEEWPRLWHNLRASCESDLAREYPIATVCKWIGNTVTIAARHYIQVTDADFDRACAATDEATQNPTYTAHVRPGIDSLPKSKDPVFAEKNEVLLLDTNTLVEAAGIEPASRDVSG